MTLLIFSFRFLENLNSSCVIRNSGGIFGLLLGENTVRYPFNFYIVVRCFKHISDFLLL